MRQLLGAMFVAATACVWPAVPVKRADGGATVAEGSEDGDEGVPKETARPKSFAERMEDRFKDEPERPKARTPVRFGNSYAEALAEAKRTDRRLLAVFTGQGCWWCRVLENRTFTDAEVAELSRQFVCVEVYKNDAHAKIWDEFRIEAIPRSFIVTPDGERVDQLDGYLDATGFAAWLRAGLTKKPRSQSDHAPAPPNPVGADEERADIVVWFVDHDELMARWDDANWTGHMQLLRLMERAGLRPRIEHLSQWELPARWDHAVEVERLPDIVASARLTGTLRKLSEAGRLRDISSNRLMWRTEWASCQDFGRRFVWLVRESSHPSEAHRAVEEIQKPAPGSQLADGRLGEPPRRDEAARVAAQAAKGYLSGDATTLSAVVSSRSYLMDCKTAPSEESWMAGMRVTTSDVDLRGNERFALAIVETRRENDQVLARDPVLVVLVDEDGRWRVLAVTADDSLFDAAVKLGSLTFDRAEGGVGPKGPRLVAPSDGDEFDDEGLRWERSIDDEPAIAQVAELIVSGFGSEGWPDGVSLFVFPGDARRGSILPATSGEK
ncbi:MAG TPA: thioredoxin family protein, partial [Pirellulales bacterium]|nr:thioredoxin family protein [Pirellulales bacterium]